MLSFLLHTTLLLSIGYAMLMIVYTIGWRRKQSFTLPGLFHPKTKITVVIPARNEGQNIGRCLKAIEALRYPKTLLQIIVADDHSTDDTATIASSFENVTVINMVDFPVQEGAVAFKKRALSKAIDLAEGTLIVTTDADCTMGEEWLMYLAACYEKTSSKMIIAPVDFIHEKGVVSLFQSIDFMTMQGITMAVHELNLGAMANGANLAFEKKSFVDVGGYEGTTAIASGDDYLLLHKFLNQYPNQVAYVKAKEAIVYTTPQTTWRGFLQQRIRWASKAGTYTDAPLHLALLLVYCFNCCLLLSTVALFFYSNIGWSIVVLWCIKVLAEMLLFMKVAPFFAKQRQWLGLVLLQPLHVLYIFLAGFLGKKGKYNWKGRVVH